MENFNSEKFIFKIGKFIFKSSQPGIETRKTVALVGIIFIFVLLLSVLSIYFLMITVPTAALCGAILAASCTKKRKGRQDRQ